MTQIRDRCFAITGAASGIGRALALEIAGRGGHVAVSDVDARVRETAALCEALGAKIHHATVDVADREAVYAWADDVVDHFGSVHGIVNNAGVSLTAMVEDMDYDDFAWLMDINFWGVVYGTKAFLPHLRASGAGHVVNISSLFGIIAVPTNAAYNASKFAVRGFTEALRQEMLVERAPVKVTCVHPGGIRTNIARSGRHREMTNFEPKRDLIEEFEQDLTPTTAEEAGRVIANAIEKGQPRLVVGLDAKAMERMQRLMPVKYQSIVAKFFARRLRRK